MSADKRSGVAVRADFHQSVARLFAACSAPVVVSEHAAGFHHVAGVCSVDDAAAPDGHASRARADLNLN